MPDDDPGDPGFASDLTDNRARGDWKSRYERAVWKQITVEAAILALYAALGLATLAVTLKGWQGPENHEGGARLPGFIAVASSGLVGGTAFSAKWLYHSVARTRWHEDRRVWRLLSPLVGAIIAIIVAASIWSGFLGIFNAEALVSASSLIALGGLVGLFSDLALGKLGEVAHTLFGTDRVK